MKLSRLLLSPPPPVAWFIASDRITVVRRERGGGLHGAAASLPEGVVVRGAVGVHGVAAERLAEVLARLGGAGDRGRRPAVVVPSAWVRCHVLDVEGVRNRRELDEVVRWRLKKLLPVPPEELRLVVEPLEGADGRRRVLCVAALERAVAGLEDAFSRVGMSVGILTPQLFAVIEPGSGWSLTVEVAEDAIATAVFSGAVLRVLRLRSLAPRTELVSAALGELRLVAQYLRTRLGVDGRVEVAVAADLEMAVDALRSWVERQEDLVWHTVAASEVAGVDLSPARRLAVARLLGGSS